MQSPQGQSADHGLVEQFLDAMWMERGLSENTLVSYRTDLSKLLTWMEKHNYRLDFISLSGLQDYQGWLAGIDFKQNFSCSYICLPFVVCSNIYIMIRADDLVRC